MSPFLLAALLIPSQADVRVHRDSSDTTRREVSVTLGTGVRTNRSEPRRVPVTEEHLRTAFTSPAARTLLLRARSARLSQDSALMSYDATAHLRISAGMGFAKIGRDRLIFRHENVTDVRWHRDVGAWIDVKGARTAIPVIPEKDAEREARQDINEDSEIFAVPYYPGQEQLISFNGSGVVQSQVDEREIVHPLAEGSEAYYTFAAGDSVVFRLPDGRTVSLRELKVRPREPKWNVTVGSLWFDAGSGQLVRAAYRLAVPLDVWTQVKEEEPDADDDIPFWVKPLISPMRMQVSAIAMEYGLYQGRFWLPRLRSAEGDARVSFMRVPFKFEQSFRYASVNALDSLPEITVPELATPPESLSVEDRDKWRDSVRVVRRAARRAAADSVKQGLKAGECDDIAAIRTRTRRGDQGSGLKIAVRVPCDDDALANSPDLPGSIFDDGEEIFGSAERDELVKQALAMGAQPPFAFGSVPPTLSWGLEHTRFNRVEGLSTGLLLEQKLGAGYTASLLARIGHADLEPNADLTLARSNLSATIRGRAYNRLVSANDWGNPLSFGSSVSALLFGRDEGFYYRASGAELEWTRERGSRLSWRLFAERQRTAAQEVGRALGPAFVPNIAARTGQYAGVATRMLHTRGLDPNGFRVFTDLRMESAISDSAGAVSGRGAMDLTVSDAVGGIAAALTLAGGSSLGPVPPQRRWYLGGAHTVRGQRADTAQAGSAFWLGRLELGTAVQGLRPVVFGDLGWVGERTLWRDGVRPMSGVGIGLSALDGLIRLDLARGLYPQKATRLYMYLDAPF